MIHRLRFIPGRLVQSIPVALGVTLIVFFMAHLLPGNAALALLGQRATAASVAALTAQLGLDKPSGSNTSSSSANYSREILGKV